MLIHKEVLSKYQKYNLPFRWYATYSCADLAGVKNGYFGLKFPTAVKALTIFVAAVCSRYPNIGKPVTGNGSLGGGSLWGRVKFEYFSGNLKKKKYHVIKHLMTFV